MSSCCLASSGYYKRSTGQDSLPTAYCIVWMHCMLRSSSIASIRLCLGLFSRSHLTSRSNINYSVWLRHEWLLRTMYPCPTDMPTKGEIESQGCFGICIGGNYLILALAIMLIRRLLSSMQCMSSYPIMCQARKGTLHSHSVWEWNWFCHEREEIEWRHQVTKEPAGITMDWMLRWRNRYPDLCEFIVVVTKRLSPWLVIRS